MWRRFGLGAFLPPRVEGFAAAAATAPFLFLRRRRRSSGSRKAVRMIVGINRGRRRRPNMYKCCLRRVIVRRYKLYFPLNNPDSDNNKSAALPKLFFSLPDNA